MDKFLEGIQKGRSAQIQDQSHTGLNKKKKRGLVKQAQTGYENTSICCPLLSTPNPVNPAFEDNIYNNYCNTIGMWMEEPLHYPFFSLYCLF